MTGVRRSLAALACLALCAFDGAATSAMAAEEITLRVEPLKASVKPGEEIGVKLIFIGGARETTLILPMGADASGIITFRATEAASGREWTASKHDPRSFAADDRRPFPAGGRLELLYDALWFEDPARPFQGGLPAGTYRIVTTYDEGRTFRAENRTSRVIHSEPAEITVTAR